MMIKECRLLDDRIPRITVLEPGGRNLVKLASVLPEVESFIGTVPRQDDSAYWIHLIALTASEYYGQNRNGDHWSLDALSFLPEGWCGKPEVDRELSKTVKYGTGTYYGAHVFPHHQNQNPNLAIGSVELAVWNPKQFWVELVIRLDKARTAESKVKWVLERISKGAPFDVSMGARVPFDMATIGDIEEYRKAEKLFDPGRHDSPAAAVLERHKLLKAQNGVGIYGLSITRNDYIELCKTAMGKILEDGRQIGVRNDYPRFFDISIVYIGADKVAKYISKLAGDRNSLRSELIRRQSPAARAIEMSYDMLKAASEKGATVQKRSDIIKDVEPAFDDKSIRVLSATEPDLAEPVMRRLEEHPNLDRVLSTLASLGIVLKPREYNQIAKGRSVTGMDSSLFDPEVAAAMLGPLRRRSALMPVISNRIGEVSRHGGEPSSDEPGEGYRDYRRRVLAMMDRAPDEVFERNPDLWMTMLGRRGKVPLVGRMTRRYAELAHLPPVLDRKT